VTRGDHPVRELFNHLGPITFGRFDGGRRRRAGMELRKLVWMGKCIQILSDDSATSLARYLDVSRRVELRCCGAHHHENGWHEYLRREHETWVSDWMETRVLGL
jgi:hypothetical protein